MIKTTATSCRQSLLSGRPSRSASIKLCEAKAKLQTAVCELKNRWWSKKAEDLQTYVDTNNTKALYDALKTIHGSSCIGTNEVFSFDNNALHSSPPEILKRSKEQFQQLLAGPPPLSTLQLPV